MKPEALVILIPGFAANDADSTCLPSQQSFIRMLKEKYPTLNIFVLAFQYPFVPTEYDLNGARVIAFGGRGRSKLFRLLLWRKVWKKLKHINSSQHIIGLLSFWCGECALVGHRFGKKYNIKQHCWIMGQDARSGNKYVAKIKPAADELIALSDFIQRGFENNYGRRPQQVIPLGIDPAQFATENIFRDIDVLGAGSLIPLKQYDVFIEVIGRIKNQLPGIKAILYGKGPEENKLRQLIEVNSLRDTITLAGELPHPKLLQQMKRSRVFLHTSEYEGFGIVCIEALYAGASVISFCKPMDKDIPHWHVVQTKEEMIQKAIDLLKDNNTIYHSILPFTMQESVDGVMQLFGK